MKSSSSRYALLDELRGLDLISMMLYHGMWDAVYLFGVVVPWYSAGQGRLWQQSICWVFILLSGFCLPLGHHPLKRGAAVFGAGVLVTAVTLLFMPEDVVWFGVLTLLGSAMLLTGLVQKWLQKIPPTVGAGGQFDPVRADLSHDGWLLGAWPASLCAAAGAVCQLPHGIPRLLSGLLLLLRLLPAAAVAVFILGGVLSASSCRPQTDGAAAPVGLPAAGLAGAALAGAVSAPSAGHFRCADAGVHRSAAALSRGVEKTAKEP